MYSAFEFAKEGAYWTGGFQAFADGGMVTGPTLGLIGEGGEPEYVIPQSKMRGAMERYSSGARGASVIPSMADGNASGDALAGMMGPIDVRYQVERINSVDYVTNDQFQTGMRQAALQGAVQGEQRTLRRLQMSTSTRKRVGL
jgi:SLT domain-containing protein